MPTPLPFPGFIGSAYAPHNTNAIYEDLINLFLERMESPRAKVPQVLNSAPGFDVFVTLPKTPVRGTFAQNDRAFAVADNTLYEIFRDRTFIERAMTVVTTPATPTVTPSALADPIAAPTAPIVTHGGTLGATTYGYKVTALTAIGETEASGEGSSAYGNATLSA